MVGDALAQELVDLGDGADANEDDLLADGLRLRQQLVEQIEVAEIADVVDHDRDEIDGLGGELCARRLTRKPSRCAAASTLSRFSSDTGRGSGDSARDATALDTPARRATSAMVTLPAGAASSFTAAVSNRNSARMATCLDTEGSGIKVRSRGMRYAGIGRTKWSGATSRISGWAMADWRRMWSTCASSSPTSSKRRSGSGTTDSRRRV